MFVRRPDYPSQAAWRAGDLRRSACSSISAASVSIHLRISRSSSVRSSTLPLGNTAAISWLCSRCDKNLGRNDGKAAILPSGALSRQMFLFDEILHSAPSEAAQPQRPGVRSLPFTRLPDRPVLCSGRAADGSLPQRRFPLSSLSTPRSPCQT